MCIMCDGSSYEEAMRSVDLSVRVHGWHLTAVEAPMPWCYTIGLTETFDHPELVVVDMEIVPEEHLIRWVVGMIERNGRLDDAELSRNGVEVVPVHERHLEGEWFGTWANHHGEVPLISRSCRSSRRRTGSVPATNSSPDASIVPPPGRSPTVRPAARGTGSGDDDHRKRSPSTFDLPRLRHQRHAGGDGHAGPNWSAFDRLGGVVTASRPARRAYTTRVTGVSIP